MDQWAQQNTLLDKHLHKQGKSRGWAGKYRFLIYIIKSPHKLALKEKYSNYSLCNFLEKNISTYYSIGIFFTMIVTYVNFVTLSVIFRFVTYSCVIITSHPALYVCRSYYNFCNNHITSTYILICSLLNLHDM